jgi:hypothetical protein
MALTPWQKAFGRDFPGAPNDNRTPEQKSTDFILAIQRCPDCSEKYGLCGFHEEQKPVGS